MSVGDRAKVDALLHDGADDGFNLTTFIFSTGGRLRNNVMLALWPVLSLVSSMCAVL